MNFEHIYKEAGPQTGEIVSEIARKLEGLSKTFAQVVKNAQIVADHSDLRNLDFQNAGHTGFASSAQLATTNGNHSTHVADTAIHAKPRVMLYGGAGTNFTSNANFNSYPGPTGLSTTSAFGFYAPRAGSLLSLTRGLFNVTVASGTVTIDVEFYKDLTELVELSLSTSTNIVGSDYDSETYSSGTHTFDAGDILWGFCRISGIWAGSVNFATFHAELEFDG